MYQIVYSQGDEEAFITEWFAGREERFLDIGASDGMRYSNTRKLVEMGWRGVLVEPNPSTFAMLLQNSLGREGVTCVNCAVASESGFQTLWASFGEWFGVSSLDKGHAERWRVSAEKHGTVFLPMTLHAVSPAELIGAFPGPYAFVTIDAEDVSWPIACALPWDSVQAELVCMEIDHDLDRADMDEFFMRLGYAHVYGEYTGNVMYGRRGERA